jgi:hypothetical protein
VKVPKPTTVNGENEKEQGHGNGEEPQLPVTLVRIPAHSQDPRQRAVDVDGASS